MPQKKRRPQPCGDCGTSEIVLAGRFDFLRDNPQNRKNQARRARFARFAVFEEFNYIHGRAIDYDDFVDRAPDQAPRFWRAAP